MKKAGWAFGVLGLCALSFFAGSRIDTAPDTPVIKEKAAPEVDWRQAVREAREGADAQQARGQALALLDEAESEAALKRAVRLLSAVAIEEDLPLLENLARSGDSLSGPAMEALGLIGGDEAFSILTSLSRKESTRTEAFAALGVTGDDRALAVLLPAMDDPHYSGAATLGLQALGTPEAERILIERFEKSSAWECTVYARALAHLPPEREKARDVLLAAARKPHGLQQEAAMFALAEVKDPILVDLLYTQASFGNATAIRALGTLNDQRAVSALRGLLFRPGHFTPGVLEALSGMTNPESQSVLLEALTAKPQLANQIVYLINRVQEPDALEALLELATSGAEPARSAARSRLFMETWSDPAPPEVLDLARSTLDGFHSQPMEAFGVLLQHGTAADIDLVTDLVLEGPQQTRMSAVWSLSSMTSALSGELLLGLCDDQDPYVASQAISAAVNRADTRDGAEALALDRVRNGEVENFAYVLIQTGSADGIAALEEQMQNGNNRSRTAAAGALMNAEDPSIPQRLVANADSMPPEVRNQIYQTALYNQKVDPTDLAKRVLATGDDSLSYVAVEALANAATPAAREQLLEMSYEPASRDSALMALSRVGGEKGQARLIEAVGDPETANAAISGLQGLGTREAFAAIEDAATGAADPSVRTNALYAIQGRGTASSEAILLGALEDPDNNVRSAAINGISNMNTPAAKDALVALLDADEGDAMAAAYALQRMGGDVYEENKDRIETAVHGSMLTIEGEQLFFDQGHW